MKKYIAEFLGTYALVFAGTGAIVIDQQTHGSITHPGVAITFGLIVMSMIYTFGDISGAHLNPAVSIAFTIAKKFPVIELAPYVVAQMLGALAASLTLKALFPTNQLLGATMPAGSEMQSFILEFILTFFLMLVILNVSSGGKEKGLFAGLAIGSVVGLEAMFAGPICGASMNPARSLAPALVSGRPEHIWIYIVATTLGAIAATPVWSLLGVKPQSK
jgi:aquaporin NIP